MSSFPIHKYHGLGNDYLVIDATDMGSWDPATLAVKLCQPHVGLGSDGLLINTSSTDRFQVQIMNPDGSEAEKSGNGLRIFARYLFDTGALCAEQPTQVVTLGGKVACTVLKNGAEVRVAMGKVVFGDNSDKAYYETISVKGTKIEGVVANTGNPHFVIPVDAAVEPSRLAALGSAIERHPRFVHRTNVQFVRVLDRTSIAIQIWERGAGITLASGSSSTACAAVMHSLGACDATVQVHMEGGALALSLDANNLATMQGAVTRVFSGMLFAEALAWKQRSD